MTGNKGTYRCSRYTERRPNQAQVGCGYREGTAGRREEALQNTSAWTRVLKAHRTAKHVETLSAGHVPRHREER